MTTRAITAAALLGYLAILVGVGVWSGRRRQSFGDYVTGGGRIPAWMLALSFLANFVSSNSFVGHAAKSYEVGLIWCLVGATMVVCCIVSWTWVAPRFVRFAREHGTTTLPEFFAVRFGSPRLGVAVNWIVVLGTLLYALAVLRGTATVAGWGLGIGYVEALGVLYVVTLVYCLLGGLLADVTTDVVQAVVLAGGAVALALALWTATPARAIVAPPIRHVPLGLVIAVGLGGGLKLLSDPKQVMVFYAFSDERQVRPYRFLVPALLAIVYAALFPVGYLARRLVVAGADLEQLTPSLFFGAHPVLPAALGIVFSVSLLAASMSSLDSAFLVIASCLEKHVVSGLAGREPTAKSARWVLLGVATVAVVLAIRPPGGIIRLTTFAGALVGASLLPGIVAGLGGARVSARAVHASVVAGVAGTFGALALAKLGGVRAAWNQDVFLGLLSATAALGLVHGLDRRAAPSRP